MDLQLNSNKAFISGSTQGIGFAIARQLVLEGAEVILNGREKEKLESAVARLKDKFPIAMLRELQLISQMLIRWMDC